MLRKLPGIDIPIATEANILHAAAYLEFKHHVERLVRDRHDTAAYTCWMHAVEVGHSPFVLPTTTEIAVLPPLPKMPCCKPECPRCAAHSGGFKFPWLGLWNTRGVILPPDVAPDEAWEYYYSHNERMDLILLSAHSSQVTAEELVPQDLYALQLRCSAGDAGALGRGEFFAAWRDWALCFPDMGTLPTFMDPRLFPRAPRGRPWASLGTDGSKAHRALRGWLEAQDAPATWSWDQPALALNMKDGTKLCPQFQRGGCKAKPCSQGVHRCAHMLRKDRVCGAFSHGASTCNGKR